MHSFLLISTSQDSFSSYLSSFTQEKQISSFDIQTISFQEEEGKKKNKQSIGIADVKQIHKVVHLTPGFGKEKVVVISDSQLLTTEAQNALLKLLEEPPLHTYLFLTSPTKESFLPTILSRCFIIELEAEEKEREESFLPETLKEAFELAEKKGKTKEESLQWIENALVTYEKLLLEKEERREIKQILLTLQRLYTTIKSTNISPRFALEQAFLSLL